MLQDIATIATVVDHIVPKARGGSSEDDNLQPLCSECHEAKTIAERNRSSNAHPIWLMRSAIPITIICGPPCAGKTTYLEQNLAHGDVRIDLDNILTLLDPAYRHWSGLIDMDRLSHAIRERNAMLGALSRARKGRAWFIVAAPAQAERDWWQGKLGGSIALLDPGIDVCKRRAVERGTPKAVPGIERWYASAAANNWQPPALPKAAPRLIGADGWPIR